MNLRLRTINSGEQVDLEIEPGIRIEFPKGFEGWKAWRDLRNLCEIAMNIMDKRERDDIGSHFSCYAKDEPVAD